MAIYSIKETFVEVPTKANSAFNSQFAYYKLVLFRFISKSSYGLITFFCLCLCKFINIIFPVSCCCLCYR